MAQALQDWASINVFPSRSKSKPLVLPWRAMGRIAAGLVQAFGFAVVMWLLLAGPGFLADGVGQPPATEVARR